MWGLNAADAAAGDKAGIPVSPFLKLGSLVVKHKSIEGGMGLHFFENFAQASGTRWTSCCISLAILQQCTWRCAYRLKQAAVTRL
jgi:hypothetical protein